VREIVDRQGGAAELAPEALGRVSHPHWEERLREAQAILGMLGRTGQYTHQLTALLSDAKTLALLLERRR
jgi:hypothetical protein